LAGEGAKSRGFSPDSHHARESPARSGDLLTQGANATYAKALFFTQNRRVSDLIHPNYHRIWFFRCQEYNVFISLSRTGGYGMKCLIIAAGRGKRLQEKGTSKPLVQLGGKPLIEHVISAAYAAGADDFYVVVGHEAERVKQFLRELAGRLGIPITFIHNTRWAHGENGASTLTAKDYLHEPFLLLMSDILFDQGLIRKLVSTTLQSGEVAITVDDDLKNPWVDLEDFCAARVEDGKMLDFGNHIPVWNVFVTGQLYCTPAIFTAIEQTMEHGDSSLAGALRHMTSQGLTKAVMVGGHFWIDVDDPPVTLRRRRRCVSTF
jgi:1L-myo-inositol 1-phosphate cytidylyltransferase